MKRIVGIGELLWDLLPSGARLGGAPANFAYMASLLGASSAVVSCVGDDERGREARSLLQEHGLDISNVQIDAEHPTGSVEVRLSPKGTPSYSILQNVAWDYVRWTPELAELAAPTDAVCFGTLAQRNACTRETIYHFLQYTAPKCLRILDVNCRAPFCSVQVVRDSFANANVLKLSSEELEIVLSAADIQAMKEERAALALQEKFNFKAVCITCGDAGSIIAMDGNVEAHPGVKTVVADTVGAGDAFVAAVAVSLLNGLDVKEISEASNRVAAWVVARHGAMPATEESDRNYLQSITSHTKVTGLRN